MCCWRFCRLIVLLPFNDATGLTTVELATVGLATIELATVGLATIGLAHVGLATVSSQTVGAVGGFILY